MLTSPGACFIVANRQRSGSTTNRSRTVETELFASGSITQSEQLNGSLAASGPDARNGRLRI